MPATQLRPPLVPAVTRGDASAAAALHTIDLCSSYGDRGVLTNVSIECPVQQVTAIMGPSGCGKSTLVKALNRTLELTPGARVTGGGVFFRDQDLYAREVDNRAVRKVIGIIHQRPQPFPMSIEENVLFGVRFHQRLTRHQRHDLVEACLQRTGLWTEVRDRLHQPAHQLSGGQQQRLCLARTLANQPEVLLMDEPCSSLDPASTERIEQLVAELKRDYTIVIVTHNVSQAKRVADRVVLMMEGQVLEQGEAEQVFDCPRTTAGADFLAGRIG
ncbi:MAG: phosphate ABC transporter ATP-binding protein [Gammaproteobacteria bacterium]|nr:phosphate ABC transporter ATP-binding protein [Gammaproteobacteria bacterium]